MVQQLKDWSSSDYVSSFQTSLLLPVHSREASSFEIKYFRHSQVSHFTVGYRVNLNGQIYHSEEYGKYLNSCSYAVRLKHNDEMHHGIIEYFIMVENEIYCCCRLFSNNFVSITRSLKKENFKNKKMIEVLQSNCFNKYFYVKLETSSKFLFKIECIRNKCIIIKRKNSALFTITDIINEYEHD